MKTFYIEITEKLVKRVEVEAKNIKEATDKVVEDYYDEKIVLTEDDFTGGTTFKNVSK